VNEYEAPAQHLCCIHTCCLTSQFLPDLLSIEIGFPENEPMGIVWEIVCAEN